MKMCVTGLCKTRTNAPDGRSHSKILKGLDGAAGQRRPRLINSKASQVSPRYYSELKLKHAHKKI